MGDVAPPSNAGAAGSSLAGLLASAQPNIQAPNILGALQQGQQLQTARYQNQELAAARALGQDYQRNIVNGKLDLSGFQQSVANDPTAAFAAEKGIGDAIANAANGYNLHMKKYKVVTDALGAALAQASKDPANARKYFHDGIIDAVSAGGMTPSEGAIAAVDVTRTPPGELIPRMQILANSLNDARASAENIVGQFGVLDEGGQFVPYRINPYGPPQPAGVAIPKTMTPGQAVQFQHVTGPNGQPINITNAALARSEGIGAPGFNPLMPNVQPNNIPMHQPGASLLSGGSQQLPPVNMGTGRSAALGSPTTLPARRSSPDVLNQAPPTAAAPPAGNGATANPAGVTNPASAIQNGVIMGPKPGVVSGLEAAAKQQADIGNQIVAEGKDVTQNLSNLEDLGAQINDANPGPLADAAAKYRAALNELGISYGNKQATAAQVFTKLTNVIASGNLSGLGAGTDQKLLTVLHATPNVAQTATAAKTVLATAIGLQQWRQARYDAYQHWLAQGNLPSNAAAFNDQFQKTVSPLVLSIPYMPAAQQQAVQKYILSLPKSAQAAFVQQIQGAKSMGLLP